MMIPAVETFWGLLVVTLGAAAFTGYIGKFLFISLKNRTVVYRFTRTSRDKTPFAYWSNLLVIFFSFVFFLWGTCFGAFLLIQTLI